MSCMALGVRFGCVLLAAWAIGCSNQVESAPSGGLDTNMGTGGSTGGGPGGGSTGSGTADACTTAANWQGQKLKFDTSDSPREFADAMNALVKVQSEPAIGVSNYMAPHCVWMVAFTAPDAASSADHAATYTEMFRHPAGLWTAAPQANGWVRVVDAASKTVWIPIANVTGSARLRATPFPAPS